MIAENIFKKLYLTPAQKKLGINGDSPHFHNVCITFM